MDVREAAKRYLIEVGGRKEVAMMAKACRRATTRSWDLGWFLCGSRPPVSTAVVGCVGDDFEVWADVAVVERPAGCLRESER